MDKGDVLQKRLTGVFSRSTLVQTVWNELTGREPGYGISDIDIIYYDGEDLSYAAEDEVVAKGNELFDGIAVPVDLKNQARVHLWYGQKFGVEIKPYLSLEAAIDSWPTTVTSLGARLGLNGEWQLYAPFGLEDLFQLVLRPNKVLITEEVYHTKTQKWKSKWPGLTVVPWGQ